MSKITPQRQREIYKDAKTQALGLLHGGQCNVNKDHGCHVEGVNFDVLFTPFEKALAQLAKEQEEAVEEERKRIKDIYAKLYHSGGGEDVIKSKQFIEAIEDNQ